MWLTILSDQLPIVALVSRYPTNKLIGRGAILKRQLDTEATFDDQAIDPVVSCGISTPLGVLFPTQGQVPHALLTRSTLYSPPEGDFLARLACLIHAANVRSEP